MTGLSETSVPKVIGHRGAAGHAPENTLAGFRKAAELGVKRVEFDAVLTRDSHIVIFHDETLARTTDGKGNISETGLSDLKALDAGSWFSREYRGETVPTLDETMATLAALGLGANIEIKPSPDREQETGTAVAHAVESGWPTMLPPPLLSSFEPAALVAAREAAPDLARAYLVHSVPADWREKLEMLGCDALHCLESRLSRDQAKRIIDAGYALRCYTVNSARRARTLFRWVVESVFTDYPDRLLDI